MKDRRTRWMYGMRRGGADEPERVKNRVVGAKAGQRVQEHGDGDMEAT